MLALLCRHESRERRDGGRGGREGERGGEEGEEGRGNDEEEQLRGSLLDKSVVVVTCMHSYICKNKQQKIHFLRRGEREAVRLVYIRSMGSHKFIKNKGDKVSLPCSHPPTRSPTPPTHQYSPQLPRGPQPDKLQLPIITTTHGEQQTTKQTTRVQHCSCASPVPMATSAIPQNPT